VGFSGAQRHALVREDLPRGLSGGLELAITPFLNKRESFRAAFAGFDMDKVALFDDADEKRLLLDAGIVRHRGKIASTIDDARRAQELRAEFGQSGGLLLGLWPAAAAPAAVTHQTLSGVTTSPESIALSKDLRKRGWKTVGPTTMYAFMQAMGLVNDHLEGCHARERAAQGRPFCRPARLRPRLRQSLPTGRRGRCRARRHAPGERRSRRDPTRTGRHALCAVGLHEAAGFLHAGMVLELQVWVPSG